MGLIDNLGFLAQAAQKTGANVSLRDLMAMREQQATDEERRYQRGRESRQDRLMDTPVEVPGFSMETRRPTTPSDIAGIVNQGRASVGLPGVPDIASIADRQFESVRTEDAERRPIGLGGHPRINRSDPVAAGLAPSSGGGTVGSRQSTGLQGTPDEGVSRGEDSRFGTCRCGAIDRERAQGG